MEQFKSTWKELFGLFIALGVACGSFFIGSVVLLFTMALLFCRYLWPVALVFSVLIIAGCLL